MAASDAETVERLKTALGARCLEIKQTRPRRIFVRVNPADYKSSVKDLVQSLKITHVSTMTGLDTGKELELLTHMFGQGAEITLKVTLPRENPEIDSIVDIVPGADVYEREVHDLVGIGFKDRSLKRFILPEEWPEGVYPLRKDFKKPD